MEKVHIRPLRFTAGFKKGHFGFPEIFQKLYELSEMIDENSVFCIFQNREGVESKHQFHQT